MTDATNEKPEPFDLNSDDVAARKRADLMRLFPEVFNEGKIDLDQLRRVMGDWVDEGTERFGLTWPGKAACMKVVQAPATGALRPDRDESVNFDDSENVFIEGDNLEVLKLLDHAYFSEVKMIYIDPPYNTGEEFIYPDRFAENLDTYLAYTRQIDREGRKFGTNFESSGRFHSRWLNMMYPRLYRSKNLLSDDGVICISINDKEVHNLRNLCNIVFGEENFVAQFIWSGGRKNDSKLVSNSHEYLICYAKSLEHLNETKRLWRQRKHGLDDIYAAYRKIRREHNSNDAASEALKEWYKNLPDSDPAKRHKHYCQIDDRGIYFPDNISWPGGGGPTYEVLHPSTGRPCKVPSRGWMFGDSKRMQEVIDDQRVHFGEDENKVPCIKSYLTDREFEVPYSVFYQDGRAATKRLRTLLGGDYFDHPKDENVLRELIEAITYDQTDALMLDFFAGSSSFAHAVMKQNAHDGGARRFVVVQLPEELDEESEAAKAGFSNIAEISRARLRAAITAEGNRRPRHRRLSSHSSIPQAQARFHD